VIKKPIIIVTGEPYSIFSEILFKAIKLENYNTPFILIGSKDLLTKQMKKLNYNFKFNLINRKRFHINEINKKKINLINVDLNLIRHLKIFQINQIYLFLNVLLLL
tara:strand:- start:162 stop:479 length:318 start_codon:yes stop_codon:yes gene_type:complete